MVNEKTAAAIYDTSAYKRSRFAYLCECGFEYFVTLLVTDSFLAYLLQKVRHERIAYRRGFVVDIVSLSV